MRTRPESHSAGRASAGVLAVRARAPRAPSRCPRSAAPRARRAERSSGSQRLRVRTRTVPLQEKAHARPRAAANIDTTHINAYSWIGAALENLYFISVAAR